MNSTAKGEEGDGETVNEDRGKYYEVGDRLDRQREKIHSILRRNSRGR